jgi:pyridoxal phosphate enzyme (YggS family)
LPSFESDFAHNLALVEERIQRAAQRSGRPRASITLLAVSKKFPAERLAIAYRAGLREFGENYVQEFAEKQPALAELSGARYHLIGHLQSNKSRLACDLFQVIQTVDSPKLLKRLDSSAAELGDTIEAMIEVKLSAEESKSGADPAQLPALLEAAAACPHVTVTGLMTMPPWSEDPEHSRPYFRQLATLARQYHLPKLSMGMSGDLEAAIEEGATMVRVGTALFGKRPKPPSA